VIWPIKLWLIKTNAVATGGNKKVSTMTVKTIGVTTIQSWISEFEPILAKNKNKKTRIQTILI
jgi:hypothetical protein